MGQYEVHAEMGMLDMIAWYVRMSPVNYLFDI